MVSPRHASFEARRLQALWQFDDLAAHNMAVLAMVQTAYQLHALNPDLKLASRKTDIRRVLDDAAAAAERKTLQYENAALRQAIERMTFHYHRSRADGNP